MHAAVMTRPDIAHVVQQVAQFMSDPQPAHCAAVKRILRYLRGTADYQLTFGPSSDSKVIAYCDADFANDPDTRKSISGYALMFNGGCFTWSSRKQTSVSLSTAEAEYISAVHAAKSVSWLRTLLRELHLISDDPIDLRIDNQSAIALINLDNSVNERSKHIDVRYHWIRDAVRKGIISPSHIPSELNISDILTKPLVIAVVVCDYFLARRCYFFLFLYYFFSFSFLTFLIFNHMTKEKTSIRGAHQEH